MRRANPLVTLGIPLEVIKHEMGNGEEGLERLKQYATRAARALRQLYHNDVGRLKDPDMLAKIDAAVQALDYSDLEVVAVYARALVSSTSVYTSQVEELAQQAEESMALQRRALLDLLQFVDSTAVICAEKASVLIGHRRDLIRGDRYTFEGTYVLEVDGCGLGILYRLPHPGPMPMSYLEPPTWDVVNECWQTECLDADLVMQPYLLRPAELYTARLVGGVSLADARELAQRPQASMATRVLQGGSAPENPGDLTWHRSSHAWWLEAMHAPLEVGDLAVIVNDGTGLVALAGEVIAVHMPDL